MSYWDYKFYIIYLVSLNCGKKYIKGEETKKIWNERDVK